jgi:NitT/TauT family transport system ATP-binding protein
VPRSALLRLQGVGKTFPGGTVALDGLDFAVHDGDFLSLLGPSGCGKSTALRIIAGLLAPSTGRLERPADRAVEGGTGERGAGEIGFVFQDPTLMPWATVFANVWLPLRLAGWSRTRARPRIEEALELVGLADVAAAYPRELSGGMRMRASIARALVIRPRLLLLDEPFAALDEITRFRLNDDLLRLWRGSDLTVVFVTHSVFESVYLSGRVLVLSPAPGRVTAEIRIAPSGPRDAAFRTSRGYAALARRVSDALRQAMGDGASGEEAA